MPAATIEASISAIGIGPVAQRPSSGLTIARSDGDPRGAVAEGAAGVTTTEIAVRLGGGAAAGEQPTSISDRPRYIDALVRIVVTDRSCGHLRNDGTRGGTATPKGGSPAASASESVGPSASQRMTRSSLRRAYGVMGRSHCSLAYPPRRPVDTGAPTTCVVLRDLCGAGDRL